MLDDFVGRAILGGIGVALAAGPLGCFVVWRRMAYFGDSLAHSALLGVALGFLLAVDVAVGIVATAAAFAVAIVLLQQQRAIASDTLLGLLSHAALALGLVVISFMDTLRVDLVGYLFGDVLAIGTGDLAWIWGGGALMLLALAAIWRPLLLLTIHEELAAAEGARPLAVRLVFTLLLALLVALAMKVVGVILVTALLIIPAAAARPLARSPEAMAVMAALIGAVAVVLGIGASLLWDTPSGPSIVVAGFALFLFSLAAARAAGASGLSG
jgi:zinc transport system permease protein